MHKLSFVCGKHLDNIGGKHGCVEVFMKDKLDKTRTQFISYPEILFTLGFNLEIVHYAHYNGNECHTTLRLLTLNASTHRSPFTLS